MISGTHCPSLVSYEGNVVTRKEISVRRILAIFLGIGLALSSAIAQDRDKAIRLGGNVAQANLLSRVTPVYPAEAKQNRIQGTVKLEITIDKEGHVSAVSVIGGPTELIQSATDAVQQWVYRPTLLNGEPVNVLRRWT
jgi:TonB family protein